jgi:hypothetical protein
MKRFVLNAKYNSQSKPKSLLSKTTFQTFSFIGNCFFITLNSNGFLFRTDSVTSGQDVDSVDAIRPDPDPTLATQIPVSAIAIPVFRV